MGESKMWMAYDGKRNGPVRDTPEEAALAFFKKYPGGSVDVFRMRAVSERSYVAWVGPTGQGLCFQQVTEDLARQGITPPSHMTRRDVTVAEALDLLLQPDVPIASVAVRRDISETAIDARVDGVWHALNITSGTANDVVKGLQARSQN